MGELAVWHGPGFACNEGAGHGRRFLAGWCGTHARARPVRGAFGTPLPARALDRGMGEAVGRRTVFRPADHEDFGHVADRVATGNTALLATVDPAERAQLRNAIATGALLTSGRHLQHGDAGQPGRNMEMFTNCATAICSFAKLYLLLNGSGVGRAYDDELCIVDWAQAPELKFVLSPDHPDYPRDRAGLLRFGLEMQILPWGTAPDAFDAGMEDQVRAFVAENVLARPPEGNALRHLIDDSREGWGKAVEMIEAMAFRGARDRTLVLDFSAIRRAGSPIAGMQGRPASGPVSPLRGLLNVRRHVIEAARAAACRYGSRRCGWTITSRSRCRWAAPAVPRAWPPSPGVMRMCCASSAPRRKAGCGPPTTRSWSMPNSGAA
ncbi:hypothetical protein RAA17_18480 [Komagataeibacter rhaeticus]|nr:hypothetical protein [Komagataeibacter rhaeticus]